MKLVNRIMRLLLLHNREIEINVEEVLLGGCRFRLLNKWQ